MKEDNTTQILSITELNQRENSGKMLSAKVMTKLTRLQDIPQSYLVIDHEGRFLCVSVYNAKAENLDKKIQK